jgi:hypothetical protein
MDYKTDIAKYTASINDKAVDAIVKFCGIALQSRKGFATKILGLNEAESDKIIKQVCEQMKADKTKHRVTFYYLMAEATGKVGAIA